MFKHKRVGRPGLFVGVLVLASACAGGEIGDIRGGTRLGPEASDPEIGNEVSPLVCPGASPDVSAQNGWRGSEASTPADGALRFELKARPTAASLDGVVAIGAENIDNFPKAAIAVRFADDGLVDVRDGGFYSSDLAYPYEPGVWYSIAISADIDAETYDVEIGPCGEPRQSLIEDAAFRDNANVSGQLSAWAVWSSQAAPLEVSTPAWMNSEGCAPATCLSLGHACGEPNDGCGGALSCGSCSGGELCSSGTCIDAPANASPPPPPSCTLTSCQSLGTECGQWGDGCGGILSCGSCNGGKLCSAGVCVDVTPNAPPPPSCTPTSCQSLGTECAQWGDGCGGILSCGSCSGGETCSIGVCVPPAPPACTPASCQSLGAECGLPSDGCGGTLSCGSCSGGEMCSSGTCIDAPIPPPDSAPPLGPSDFPSVATTGITDYWCPRWDELKSTSTGSDYTASTLEYQHVTGILNLDGPSKTVRCLYQSIPDTGSKVAWGFLCAKGQYSGSKNCTDLLVEDTTIWAEWVDAAMFLQTNDATTNRVRIRPGCDAMKSEGGLHTNNYFGADVGHTSSWPECGNRGHHMDGLQSTGNDGAPIWLVNNTIFGPYQTQGQGLFCKGDFGICDDVTLEHNLTSGGSTAINMAELPGAGTWPRNIRITNNKVVTGTVINDHYTSFDGSGCLETKVAGAHTNFLTTGPELSIASHGGNVGSCGAGISPIPVWNITNQALSSTSCTQGNAACNNIDITADANSSTLPNGTNSGDERWRYSCGGSPSNSDAAPCTTQASRCNGYQVGDEGADLWYNYPDCNGLNSCTMTDVCDFQSEGAGTYTVKVYSEAGVGAGVRPSSHKELTFTVN